MHSKKRDVTVGCIHIVLYMVKVFHLSLYLKYSATFVQ